MTGLELAAVFASLLLGLLGVGAVFYWTWRNTGGQAGRRWDDFDEPSAADAPAEPAVIDLVREGSNGKYVYPEQAGQRIPPAAAGPASAGPEAPTAPLQPEPAAQESQAPPLETLAEGETVALADEDAELAAALLDTKALEAEPVAAATSALPPRPEPTPELALESDHERRRVWPAMLVALLLLLLPVLVWLGLGWQSRNDDQRFIVLVAPFREEGSGQVTDTGRALANALVVELNQSLGGRGMAVQVPAPPADGRAAAALLENDAADLLVWGEVRPGGLLDRPSVRPTVYYRPTGIYAPVAFDGYNGRFAPPPLTQLSDVPINAGVVLPALVDALDAYARGEMDLAYNQLEALVNEYGLRPALPGALRANILWSRGEYDLASAEYRRALAGAGPELPFLLNNLAAVQLDAGLADNPNDPGELSDATNTLAQALQSPGAEAVPAIRINRATAALYRNEPEVALRELVALPANFPRPLVALLTEAAAIRACNRAEFPNLALCGDLDAAEALLAQARELTNHEAALAPAEFRNLIATRLRGVVEEQQQLLTVSRLLSARGSPLDGPLEWELEVIGPLDSDDLRPIAERFEPITEDTQALAQAWRSLNVASDAAGKPIRASIADGQAGRIEYESLRQRYLEALLLVEAGRANPPATAGFLRGLWNGLFGRYGGPARAIRLLGQPELLASYEMEVQLGRAHRLLGNTAEALAAQNLAREFEPDRPEPLFYLAELAYDAGEVDRSVDLLRQAIGLDAGYFPARQRIARIELNRSNPVAALEQLRWLSANRASFGTDLIYAETLHRLGPAYYAEAETVLRRWESLHVSALLELGRLYRSGGRLEASADVLGRAVGQEAGAMAHYEYGRTLAALGRPQEAAAQYELAGEADGDMAPAYVALAELYSGPLDNREQAIRNYQRALDTNTSDPGLLVNVGDAFLKFGQPDEAYVAYERARRANPNDPLLYQKLALAALEQNRPGRARTHAQEALARNPNLAEARVALGEIARREGQFSQAADLFAQALQLDGSLEEAYLGLGRTSGDQGDWRGALTHFQRAVATNPENYLTHFWLAEAYVRQPQPDYTSAIAAYAASLSRFGEFPEATFGLAQAYYGLGQNQDAWNYLDRALTLKPRYAEALLLRGKLYQELGDLNNAMADYNESIRINDDIAESFYRRGQMYLQSNQIEQAQRDLARAVRLQDNFAEAHYWLGRAYFAEANYQAALDAFERALQLRPDYAEVQNYRDQTRQRLESERAAAR
jgi:tetratricopeptide (TPR) repeat protein